MRAESLLRFQRNGTLGGAKDEGKIERIGGSNP